MKFKLIEDSKNDLNRIKEVVLANRGIGEMDRFLKAGKEEVHDYGLLDNMDEAVACAVKHIEADSNIHIVVDSDCDGLCSAAMVYRYFSKAGATNLNFSMHIGKAHGLSKDIVIPKGTELIVLPDSSSNDYEQHEKYSKLGCDILILDHHEAKRYSEHAIVVNNQLSKGYPNKDLCGAGIVYKFLQAMDAELWLESADEFLDLVAVANIGDMMDSRTLETRHYMNRGLGQIRSNMIRAFIDKVEDRMGKLTLIGVAFYVVPLMNAMIRVGTMEQKELLFRAFCDLYEEFDYKKRDGTIIKETIYERAARECSNAKGRQDRQKSTVIEKICSHIEKNGLDENKIIMINGSEMVGKDLTGLIANGLAEKYKRPVLLYKEHVEDVDGEKVITFGGSARNYDGFELTDLREFLLETGLFNYCEGHANAFGLDFNIENENKILEVCNKGLVGYSTDNYTYFVDFELEFEDLDDMVFHEMDKLKGIYGQRVDEPLFAIKNVEISMADTHVNKGKTQTNIKTMVDSIEFVKFRVHTESDALALKIDDWDFDGDSLTLDVVGTIGINSFAGKKTFQVTVKDWNIVGE